MLLEEGYDFRDGSLVAYHLRHVEKCRFESCRTACHRCHAGVGQQLVSLSEHYLHAVVAFREGVVVFRRDAWCSGYHYLVYVSSHPLRRPYHVWQVVFDFLFSASGEQGYHRFVAVQLVSVCKISKRLLVFLLEFRHLIGSRVAHVVDRVVVFPLVEINFEGQDREHLVHIAPYVLYSVFLPCPYLG